MLTIKPRFIFSSVHSSYGIMPCTQGQNVDRAYIVCVGPISSGLVSGSDRARIFAQHTSLDLGEVVPSSAMTADTHFAN